MARTETATREPRWRWLALALAFFIETLLWQQLLLAIAMLLYGAISGVAAYLATGPNFNPRRYRFPAASLVVALLCFGLFWFNNWVWAPAMAETIADACDEYRADLGEYPDELDDLTPEYLPVVPPAKFSWAFRNFHYNDVRREEPFLLWYAIPPFGRPTYGIADRRWKYLD